MWSVICASAGSTSQRASRAVAARSWCAAPRVPLPSLPPAAALSAAAASSVPSLAALWPEAVKSSCLPALQHCSPSAALGLPARAALVLHPAAQFADPRVAPLVPTASRGPCSTRRCRPQPGASGRTLPSAALHSALPLSALAAPVMLPSSPIVASSAVLATLAVPRSLCSLAGLCGTPSTARRSLPQCMLGDNRGLCVVPSGVWGVPGAGCQALNRPVDPTARSSAAQRVRASRAARMAMQQYRYLQNHVPKHISR